MVVIIYGRVSLFVQAIIIMEMPKILFPNLVLKGKKPLVSLDTQ